MRTLGTPLSANDLLRFGALLLDVASRVIRDQETLKYWLRHTGEFESLTREFALKPGCRVLHVDRTARPVAYKDHQIIAQDSSAAGLEDIDVSRIRYIRYSKFDAQYHIHLDTYVLATLLQRLEALPPRLRNSPNGGSAVNFLGTEFEEPAGKDGGYVWVSCWYPTNERGQMNIVRKKDELGHPSISVGEDKDDAFIAVLLKD